ncbi:hypothetical protein C1645_871625 [Glomus cerebriforme]|uniref:Uncharacterized protein n=1 Tax=Glomus cerebriforme TaxID=658196 RepID=A0A397TG05_9GLOM|nr:hypothetical protein C1645_871625 [Glomus cerebriforme]
MSTAPTHTYFTYQRINGRSFSRETCSLASRRRVPYLKLIHLLPPPSATATGNKSRSRIDAIPLFFPPIYDDDDKLYGGDFSRVKKLRVFARIVDGLESMRKEYVVAILHIVKDDTKNSVCPQHEIIEDSEDLICITEHKQHKVPMGFAQVETGTFCFYSPGEISQNAVKYRIHDDALKELGEIWGSLAPVEFKRYKNKLDRRSFFTLVSSTAKVVCDKSHIEARRTRRKSIKGSTRFLPENSSQAYSSTMLGNRFLKQSVKPHSKDEGKGPEDL